MWVGRKIVAIGLSLYSFRQILGVLENILHRWAEAYLFLHARLRKLYAESESHLRELN